MIYQTPELLEDEIRALDRISELRNQLRYQVSEPKRWLGPLRRALAARAIQGSNSIEGFNVSVEDAVAAIEGAVEPETATLENWQAVMGYRRAMTYVLQLADDPHFQYTSELLRSLHFMMTECSLDASPGRWRPGPIWVRNDATGDTVYEAPPAELIPELVAELIESMQGDPGSADPMVRSAMAHLNLVMIHPFRDGNGRMSRCLQSLVLVREQILSPEWSSIEEYLGRNTDQYYQALAEVGQGNWNPGRDARSWVRFCIEAHYVQATSVLRRVIESGRFWSEIERLRIANRLPQRSEPALYNAMIGMRLRNASYRMSVKGWDDEEISNQVATTDLRALVKAGLLIRRGQKRGTFYVAAEPLTRFAAEVRAARQPIDPSILWIADAA